MGLYSKRDRRQPGAFLEAGTSSFTEFLTSYAPELLPSGRLRPAAGDGGGSALEFEHGTTIVAATYADIEASRRDLGFEPRTPISVGIPKFADWYLDYYGVAAP